ncbi:DNA cytosine methyltransferase [Clostridium sp.]|jgi:DNA (cytosine-5)-methyltransferase 1|uniref:DNA cytosine methyltransferase n=1 Tax=Clostridium sp. TaxID=1506 RepID=UPI003A5BBE64
MKKQLNAISLFSSSGIGDLGLQANRIQTVIACEILEERMKLFQNNYPTTKCFCGDIWNLQEGIVDFYKTNYDNPPFVILATPPCQGMSSNGMGKMLSDYRKGLRPKYDERNRLIIPAIKIIKALQPEWVIFENVANMVNTLIYDENDELINIIDYIHRELGEDYVGKPEVIDCANYGVPQHRVRLLTVLSKSKLAKEYYDKKGTFIPDITHSQDGNFSTKPWVTLKDAIGDLPPLRAEKGKNIDKENSLHKVPLLDEKKLWWLDNTPEGSTAFNNQCINPECGYQGNKLHGAKHNKEGINKFNEDTPLYCEKCGHLLPRPYVEEKGTNKKRIMKGYTSAYKRMVWNEPASTLTQNFQYASSDNKVHPSQARVLSLWEGLIIQTIADYPFSFEINGKQVRDGLIRDTIGESVPPRIIDLLCKKILEIENQS